VAVALMIPGIALVGTLTANLAALLVEDHQPHPPTSDAVLAELREISVPLRHLEDRLADDAGGA